MFFLAPLDSRFSCVVGVGYEGKTWLRFYGTPKGNYSLGPRNRVSLSRRFDITKKPSSGFPQRKLPSWFPSKISSCFPKKNMLSARSGTAVEIQKCDRFPKGTRNRPVYPVQGQCSGKSFFFLIPLDIEPWSKVKKKNTL